jgi:L-ascorbate metabolism protein UlaG (beta-lactamase superfamily)
LHFLRWRFGLRPGDPHAARPELTEIPLSDTAAQRDRFLTGSANGLFWLGHASIFIRLGGSALLTDPLFFGPFGVRRLTPPAVRPAVLPRLDALLISHNHFDHLERRSICAFPADQRLVVPLGLAAILKRWGRHQVVELDWWQSVQVGQASVTLVPAQHWSRRGLNDENRTLWGGYVVSDGRHTVYFAGDTGFFSGFAEIGRAFAPQLAVLPIGAYAPRWFMKNQHLDPGDALDALVALGARRLLPIHWGSLVLSDEPPGEPPAWLAQLACERGLSDRVEIWPHGGLVEL